MFNMEKVGRKISELRKSRNMTQLELADRIAKGNSEGWNQRHQQYCPLSGQRNVI